MIAKEIQKKFYGSGMIALIISIEFLKYIMEIVKPLKESGLLVQDISKAIEKEAK